MDRIKGTCRECWRKNILINPRNKLCEKCDIPEPIEDRLS